MAVMQIRRRDPASAALHSRQIRIVLLPQTTTSANECTEQPPGVQTGCRPGAGLCVGLMTASVSRRPARSQHSQARPNQLSVPMRVQVHPHIPTMLAQVLACQMSRALTVKTPRTSACGGHAVVRRGISSADRSRQILCMPRCCIWSIAWAADIIMFLIGYAQHTALTCMLSHGPVC